MSRKKCHYIFAYNFAKCWTIIKILPPAHMAVTNNVIINKYPNTPQKYCYTTLWNINLKKPGTH